MQTHTICCTRVFNVVYGTKYSLPYARVHGNVRSIWTIVFGLRRLKRTIENRASFDFTIFQHSYTPPTRSLTYNDENKKARTLCTSGTVTRLFTTIIIYNCLDASNDSGIIIVSFWTQQITKLGVHASILHRSTYTYSIHIDLIILYIYICMYWKCNDFKF